MGQTTGVPEEALGRYFPKTKHSPRSSLSPQHPRSMLSGTGSPGSLTWHLSPPWDVPQQLQPSSPAFLQLFLSQALSTALSSLSWDPDTQRSFSLVRGTGIFIHLTLLESSGSVCGRKPMWVALVLQEQSRSEGQNPHQSVQTPGSSVTAQI